MAESRKPSVSKTERAIYDLSRRRFVHLCSGAAALLSQGRSLAASETLSTFPTVRLVDGAEQGIRAEDLELEREYVFFYPYVSTPCFLLRLGTSTEPTKLSTESGQTYQWPGGVGSDGRVVAFAAICSHKLTHPSEPVSFIGYRQQPVGFLDRQNQVVQQAAVIQCCSEHSIYDPAQGARVLAGPAPQPLAGIALEVREEELFATGVYGGLLYARFFERFGFRLQLEFGARAQELVETSSRVMRIEDYTRQRIRC